jgi:hypothetical protein
MRVSFQNGETPPFALCMFVKRWFVVAALVAAARAETPGHASGDAYVTVARGQVSIEQDNQPWAISSGEHVRTSRVLTTGPDGYAKLELTDGSNFEVFANSVVGFRQNAAAAGDLIDVFKGHAKVHVQPGAGQTQQRVFTPTALITALQPATFAVAIDGDELVRIDVLEGEVRVQHKLRPRSEPTIVKAVDAILVERDQQISRQLDRGMLYRYTVKPIRGIIAVLAPGHGKGAQPVEQDQLLASR